MKNSIKRTVVFKSAVGTSVCLGIAIFAVISPECSYADGSALNQLPKYTSSQLKSTRLTSVGSDTMGDLVGEWVDAYKTYHSDITVQVVNYGSASAPAALIEGTANLGHMARPMKESEVEDFKLKYGFEPTQIRAAVSAAVVYVAKSNPIKEISFNQLDAIYSSSRKRGESKRIQLWSDLGASGAFGQKKLMALGMVDTSYPYAFFKQQVLLQGEFYPDITGTANTKSLFEAIAANDNAIGYGSIPAGGFSRLPKGIKIVPIVKNSGEEAVPPSEESILSNKYPLSRYLNLYVIRFPGKPLDDALQDFLKFVLSQQGQKIVVAQGLTALPLDVVKEELTKLQ